MQTRQLGNSDLNISPIGFGAWAVGGSGWEHAWGAQDDAASIAAIHRAITGGINWIDTAPVYGLGHSEEVVGRAVKGLAERPYLFTKCSLVWDSKRNITLTYKHIRKEVEESLRRLQVETIDLYQCHWPVGDAELQEGWSVMAALQREGKVGWIGASNFSVAQLKLAQAIAPVTSLQPPYSLLNTAVEAEVLPFCQAHNIGVINYSPMQSGLLTGTITAERVANMPADDWRRSNPNFQEPRLSRYLGLTGLLHQIGARHGRSAGEVAIAWTLRHSAITGAIVGARNAAQVEGLLGAGSFRLSADEVQEIERYIAAHLPGEARNYILSIRE
jgi:aryl-alcohol dehydrogenase-like predicted oxidoreductase